MSLPQRGILHTKQLQQFAEERHLRLQLQLTVHTSSIVLVPNDAYSSLP